MRIAPLAVFMLCAQGLSPFLLFMYLWTSCCLNIYRDQTLQLFLRHQHRRSSVWFSPAESSKFTLSDRQPLQKVFVLQQSRSFIHALWLPNEAVYCLIPRGSWVIRQQKVWLLSVSRDDPVLTSTCLGWWFRSELDQGTTDYSKHTVTKWELTNTWAEIILTGFRIKGWVHHWDILWRPLFPLVCVCAVLPFSVCVDGVLVPLLAAEVADALGMMVS